MHEEPLYLLPAHIRQKVIDEVIIGHANEPEYKRLQNNEFMEALRDRTIKLTSLVSNVVDEDTQEKIDVVKTRLIKNHDYCEICATDVLSYVASIFARGDIKST